MSSTSSCGPCRTKGSYALLQAVLGLDPAAVEIVTVSVDVVAGGLCQVCGGARSSTPHHDDCWTYAGECSTFACRERRCVR